MITLRQNDIGTTIILTLKENGSIVDISGATAKRIDVRKPSGAVVQRAGSYVTNGADGILYCNLSAGDLDEVGTYRAAMYLTLGAWSGHSSSINFAVDTTP